MFVQRLVAAALVVAAVTVPATQAPGTPMASQGAVAVVTDPCATVHADRGSYRIVARRAYRHPRTPQRLLVKMAQMRHCMKAPRHRWAVRYNHKLAQRREWRTCSNTNPVACIKLAAARYGASVSWMLSCAGSEGGLDGGGRDPSYKRMNHHHSGAGGVFQFMRGTFDGDMRSMGYNPAGRWLTAKWNALAAAWHVVHYGSGAWTGVGC